MRAMQIALALLGFLVLSAPAAAAPANVRLLAGGLEPQATLLAGVQIRLPPGAKTYWRSPGDSGIAPRFDWTGSQNVAAVEVLWPAPMRFEDGDGWSIGYKDGVVLPLRVTPVAPGAPVMLRLRADYGVCEKLCVPTRADATLRLTAVGADRSLIERALARVPKPLPSPAPDGAQGVREIRIEDRDATARLVVEAAFPHGTAGADLFVEATGGWAGPRPEATVEDGGRLRFTMPASDLGDPADAVLILTTVSDAGASEQRWRLARAAAK